MNFYWISNPFLRILIPFILGILLDKLVPIDTFYYVLFFFSCTALVHFKLNPLIKINQHIFSISIFISFVLLGHQLTQLNNSTITSPAPFTSNLYSAKILSASNSSTWNRYTTQIQHQLKDNKSAPYLIKTLLQTPFDGQSLLPGDVILFRGQLKAIAPNKNPLTFNIKHYWNNKGVAMSGYGYHSEIIYVSHAQSTLIDHIRKYIISLIDANFKHDSTKGVAKALLLGDKSELDPAVKNSFMDAGAMHVLAVSGLHVGLVAGLFSMLLYPIRRRYPLLNKKIKLFVLVPVWCFAALCNFSPSVTRATIMISFYLIAEASGKKYSGVNILALTALLLLCYRPNYIYDIGFQLSFLAVLGLLLTYRPIRKSYRPNNVISTYIWDLTCVTISVQLFIIPILFFHFHRFPIYFIPNSIIAVGSLALILSMGLGMILFSFQPILLQIFAWIFEHSILALNYVLSLNRHLPLNNIEDIWIEPCEVILLFITAFSTAIWLKSKKTVHLTCIIGPFIIFAVYHTTNKIIDQNTEYISSYSIPYHTSIELINQKKAYGFISSDSISSFVNGNIHSRLNVDTIYEDNLKASFSNDYIRSSSGIIFTPKSKIWIIDNTNFNILKQLPRQAVDYLFIHNKLNHSLDHLLANHDIKQIVIDCSSQETAIPSSSSFALINTCTKGWINPTL